MITKFLKILGLNGISGNYVQNGLMFGFSYDFVDTNGNDDKHLSLWFGIFVITMHFR